MYKYLIIISAVLIMFSCQKEMKSGLDLSQMDTTVRPQDNFYTYMNGTWLKEYEIPADKSNYGSFTKLADEAEQNLRGIIEESANMPNKEAGSNSQKVGDMYQSFMDSSRIEELGIAPIQENIEAINTLSSKDDLGR